MVWNETSIRFTMFCSVLALMATWEILTPRRSLTVNRRGRWFANIFLLLLGTLISRIAFPVFPLGMALLAQERGFGILNLFQLPNTIKIAVAVILLDFVIYQQHRLFHFMPIFWRFHRVHHSDLDLDVTTGNRFHPLEILVSLAIKLLAVYLIGAPPEAVLIFEVTLNSSAMFSHGNIRLPSILDRWLRLALVTPDMHRLHHSVIPHETNSNFGFCLPWWDRLCRTYREQPEKGHEGMTIGLYEYRDMKRLTLIQLLIQPFERSKSASGSH